MSVWELSENKHRFSVPGVMIRVKRTGANAEGTGMHFHNDASIVFFITGGCVEKRTAGHFERKAADIVFLHAGEYHETILGQEALHYVSLDVEEGFLAQCHVTEQDLYNAISKSPDAKFIMLNIYWEMLRADKDSGDSLLMLFYQLASFAKSVSRKKRTPAWVTTVHDLLNDRWDENISLAELASATGISPITISKHFPSYFACTVGAYLRKLRVERSLPLIKKGRQSLTDIAYTCNFADQSHFIRNFRGLTSITPGQYKKL